MKSRTAKSPESTVSISLRSLIEKYIQSIKKFYDYEKRSETKFFMGFSI